MCVDIKTCVHRPIACRIKMVVKITIISTINTIYKFIYWYRGHHDHNWKPVYEVFNQFMLNKTFFYLGRSWKSEINNKIKMNAQIQDALQGQLLKVAEVAEQQVWFINSR